MLNKSFFYENRVEIDTTFSDSSKFSPCKTTIEPASYWLPATPT